MSAATAISDIVVNLNDQVRLYRRMLDLSQAQLAALQSHDVRAVHAILQEIEMAMLDRSKVERQRADVISRVATALGVPQEEVTASLLQEVAGGSIAESIATCSAELRMLVHELDAVVERNRVLLEHELSIIDQLVQGMTTVPGNPGYGKTGAQQQAPRLKLLDAQV